MLPCYDHIDIICDRTGPPHHDPEAVRPYIILIRQFFFRLHTRVFFNTGR